MLELNGTLNYRKARFSVLFVYRESKAFFSESFICRAESFSAERMGPYSVCSCAQKVNGSPFMTNDAGFALAYAIIMLNTDQHNHNVRKQNIPMTVEVSYILHPHMLCPASFLMDYISCLYPLFSFLCSLKVINHIKAVVTLAMRGFRIVQAKNGLSQSFQLSHCN